MSLIQLSTSNGDSLLINSGSFSVGKIIRTKNELVFYTDQYGNSTGYRWLGVLPHTINGNSPINDGGISSIGWESYITSNLYDKLKNENITLTWTAHLPTVEVAYGLEKGSLQIWTPGSISNSTNYWLYTDGTVWGGIGTLGNVPNSPFTQLHLQRDIIKYTYQVQNNGETSVEIPYEFSSIVVYINGVLQSNIYSFIVTGRVITFSSVLNSGDIIEVFLNNVPVSSIDYVLQNQLSNYVLKNDLNSSSGSTLVGLTQGGTIQDAISYVTPEMFGARGDGITDDTVALQNAFSSGKNITFPYNKTYIINDRLTATDFDIINGNGSTIKYSNTPTSGLTILTIGKSKGTISNLSILVTEGDSTVTIPGISAIISPGDLLSLRSSTLRVPATESNYLFGQRCIVRSISGDTITLFEPIYETFTITSCNIHSGKNHYEINNLNLDMTSVASTTVLVEGISITGVGMKVSNCNINGSNFCSAGLVLQGYNANIQNNIISGFLNANGVSSGGRTGYGIYIDCNNTLIQNNTLSSNKHQVTCASRQFVMKGLVVVGNNASSYGISTSEAVFDLHANVLGVPLFGYNTIHASKSSFGIRNGGAKIIGNSIYSYRPSDTTPALVGLDEYQTVYYIEFSNNKLDCGTNIRMFNFGELNTINNLIIDSNIGTIGSIIDQAMNISKINDLTITNNKLSGLSKIVNAYRRSLASTQTMFSEFNRCNISNNYFNCNNDNLTDYVINLWTHANTLSTNKLIISDLKINNNNIISTDTPIIFDFVKLTGVTSISNNSLTHTISSSTITPPTQSSIGINHTSVESLISIGNKMSGRYRFTLNSTQSSTSTTYPDEDLNITVDIQSNSGLGITFENLVNSATNRYTFGNSTITNNKFIGTYGTTIGFVTAYNPSGWNNGGIVSISNNLLLPVSGNSVGIGLGWGSHKIAITNNIISASISDSSTPYLNVNNTLAS